jgi:hypothetical protein
MARVAGSLKANKYKKMLQVCGKPLVADCALTSALAGLVLLLPACSQLTALPMQALELQPLYSTSLPQETVLVPTGRSVAQCSEACFTGPCRMLSCPALSNMLRLETTLVWFLAGW